MKTIPEQVREAIRETADRSEDNRSAIALLDLLQWLSDEDAAKLRNLLR